jgi:hypothetical protein
MAGWQPSRVAGQRALDSFRVASLGLLDHFYGIIYACYPSHGGQLRQELDAHSWPKTYFQYVVIGLDLEQVDNQAAHL